jgi:hypothetical protein
MGYSLKDKQPNNEGAILGNSTKTGVDLIWWQAATIHFDFRHR